jgi:hypothetical protein
MSGHRPRSRQLGAHRLLPPRWWYLLVGVVTVVGHLSATPVPAPADTSSPAGTVLVIGDSLCVGAHRWADLEGKLAADGWRPELVCKIGEPLTWGIEQVRSRHRVPSAVVVALGTNSGPGTLGFSAQVDIMFAELRARGATEVVWITLADAAGRYEAKSQVIRDAVRSRPWARVADWAVVIGPNPHWYLADGLHYTTEGKHAWAMTLARGLTRTGWFSPFVTAEALVDRQYRDLLRRPPEPSGTQYWATLLRNGTVDRDRFVTEVVNSAEFGGRISPIARLYLAAFDRLPDNEGLHYWISSRAPVGVIADHFATSQEFLARYGDLDDAGYVRRLYLNVLRREPDPGGAAHWLGALDAGASRGQVLSAFAQSSEYTRQTKPSIQALTLYVGLLGRDPDPSGHDYWVSVLARGTPFRSVVASFLDSAEYRQRVRNLGYRIHQP